MENMAHAQFEEDLREKQFGMPIRKGRFSGPLSKLGMQRDYPDVRRGYTACLML